MDQETLDLYNTFKGLNSSVFQTMTIQELFELRHEMLELLNKLGDC
jgi:hypothetical protein